MLSTPTIYFRQFIRSEARRRLEKFTCARTGYFRIGRGCFSQIAPLEASARSILAVVTVHNGISQIVPAPGHTRASPRHAILIFITAVNLVLLHTVSLDHPNPEFGLRPPSARVRPHGGAT